jgi:hypothetical protein
MGRAYFIPQPLGGNDGDLVTYSLVGLEVESEFGVISFDDYFGRLLDGLKLPGSADL